LPTLHFSNVLSSFIPFSIIYPNHICYGLLLFTSIVNYVIRSFCFLFNFRIVLKISWCQFCAFYACDKRISFLVILKWDGHGTLHFEFTMISINRDLGNNWANMNLDLKSYFVEKVEELIVLRKVFMVSRRTNF